MNSELVSNCGMGVEQEIPLEALPLVIGRGEDSTVRINDRWASRHNCEIVRVEGELVVRDLDSSNGTLVNGQHVAQKTLNPGDKLTVGMTTFLVFDDGNRLKLKPDSLHDARLIDEVIPRQPR